ncbi:MAG: hypothetical protein FJ009_22580, partial [Chloroflexi bacterium]|nr:hypothetical protein [Chloroflexota bacterium]
MDVDIERIDYTPIRGKEKLARLCQSPIRCASALDKIRFCLILCQVARKKSARGESDCGSLGIAVIPGISSSAASKQAITFQIKKNALEQVRQIEQTITT